MKKATYSKKWISELAFSLLLIILILPIASANAHTDGRSQEMTLIEAIEQIGRKYEVFFTFDMTLVANINVHFELDQNQKVEDAISGVLSGTDLAFKLYDRRYVIIYEIGMDGLESLKNMAKHLDGLISDEEQVESDAKRMHAVTLTLSDRKPNLNLRRPGIDVGGVVKDEAGVPLVGATILIKGTNIGTATDLDGRFLLENISEAAILILSYTGFQGQEILVDGQSNLEVIMIASTEFLDELIVVGYGSVRKRSVTSSISKLDNEILDQYPSGRAETALVGRMAGVNISQVRNGPGSSPSITIRGPGSISASNDPLIVIDGFPGGSFDNVNMNDVASIEVLKDASSAAIYGSRGSGGVIIITTKKGKSSKPSINFNSYAGFSTPRVHGLDEWIHGGQEFYDYTARYQNRDYVWVGGDPSLPLWDDERRPSRYRVNPVIKEGNYNWEDILFNSAPIQNYNLSVSGRNENTDYYISGTYKDEQGTLLNTWSKQYSLRANVNLKVSPRLDVGLMVNPNFTEMRVFPSTIQNFIKQPPFVSSERQQDGSYLKPRDYWGSTVSGGQNPLSTFEGTHDFSNLFNNVGEVYARVKLLKGLDFKTSGGFNVTYGTRDYFREERASSSNQGRSTDNRNFNLINENVLSYTSDFSDKHSINGILGASFQYNVSRLAVLEAVNNSYANEKIWTLNNALINSGRTYTSKSQWGLTSYFGRVNYSFDDKYLLSASLRTDGSSRFGPDNRWGLFPSASVAWRISEEPFFENSANINELKIRASYGVVGNFNIGDFQYLGAIGSTVYSPDGQVVQGQVQTSFGNSGLKWEKTESYDIGLDVSLFNNRINLVVDYYDKLTRDLLYNVTIPSISGFTNTIVNVGDIRNKGFELELTSRNITGPFSWQTSLNYTKNKNEVVSLGEGASEVINTHSRGMGWLLRVGESMFSYYAYRQIGVLQKASDLETYPIIPGQKVGTIRYDDVNKDGVITPEDRVVLGSFMPDFFMGMVNDFSYKNFDLSIAMQSSFGAKMYNLENLYYQGATVSAFLRPVTVNQWWSEEEPGDGKHPAASLAALEYYGNSDYLLENASFVAIRNINFGYTFPSKIIKKLRLNKLRVYLSLSNVLMLDNKEFNGFNPEGFTTGGISGINSMPGMNLGSEPIPMSSVFGLNVNF